MTTARVQELRKALDDTAQRTHVVDLQIDSPQRRSDGTMVIRGYAAVFDAPANIAGLFVERIKRGAFRKLLARTDLDVPLLFDHAGQPVARTSNGTLRLQEDTRGLRIEADLAPTTLGRDLLALISRGDLRKMSFSFSTDPGGVQWRDMGLSGTPDERDVYELSALHDVSVVTQAAYDETSVETAPPRSKDSGGTGESVGGERSALSSTARGSIRGALSRRLRLLEQEISQ